LAAYFINEASLQTELQLRKNSIKNDLSIKVAQLNAFFYNASSKDSTPSDLEWLDPALLLSLEDTMVDHLRVGPGADCAQVRSQSGKIEFCLQITDTRYCERTSMTTISGLRGRIFVLENSVAAFQPIDINFCREFRQLGISGLSCPPENGLPRIITGIDDVTNRVRCRALSSGSSCSDQGVPYGVITSRDENFNIGCRSLSPQKVKFNCSGEDQYIESISWTGDIVNPIQAVCGTRLDPFLKWPIL
jgi:hypothetical protein